VAEIVHHMGLVGVAGCKRDFGEGFAGVPQPADMLQTGHAANDFGSGAHGSAKVSFQSTLAHGGMAGDGDNGSPAFGAADEVDRGLDLRRDGGSVLGFDPAQEKALHRDELPLYRMLIGKDVLDVLDRLPGQNVLERERSIVKKVDTIMQDGRRPHLGKANDDE